MDKDDFSGGVRGKYAASYAAGTNLVLIDPDLITYFPDSEAVNNALREWLQHRELLPKEVSPRS